MSAWVVMKFNYDLEGEVVTVRLLDVGHVLGLSYHLVSLWLIAVTPGII